jgi:Tol biopolymer transport system component
VYFSFANDGTLYFTNSSPREIWYAQPTDDGYGEAQQLPSLINLLPNVAHPGIAPDGSYIVVDSYVYKDGVLVGSLYVSYRKPDGFWTKPVRLAEILNAEETDIYASPRISPDGEFLFFEHYLPETDQADICWVSTEIITGSLLE